MKPHHRKMGVSLLALAVQAAMFATPVQADEEEIAALENPANSVELGVANTSRSSAKFGEYNGLNKSGVTAIGNFSVRGGDSYGGNTGTRRWSFTGSDLGTTSRALGASFGNQGSWNVGIGYDELRHNLTDSYQTPYLGGVGGNNFTLPPGFGNTTNTRTLAPAQLAALNEVDIASTRDNFSLNAGVIVTPQWSVTFDYSHLKQSGAKLMAFPSAGGANLAAAFPGVTGEAISILPNPTNYKTDAVNLALNWNGEKGNLTTSYTGSFFRDGYDRVSFQTFAGTASAMQTMSTPPSNTIQQLNLGGGYTLAATTRLTGGFSYARNTQNDAFAYDPGMMVTPPASTSLNGLVVNTHADVKLTDQTTRDLVLSAGAKYDNRDNRTQSGIYNFNAVNGSARTVANYPNTPLSTRKAQLELAGDYRAGKGRNVRLAYSREDVSRWCNSYAVNANYPAGTNCVVATASKDDKLAASYRFRVGDEVALNFGYSYSSRRTDSAPNAIAAFIGVNGNATGGTVGGINAGDFLGFHPYFNASRKQQMVKAGVNWEASNSLSLALSGRLTGDKYDSLYGVQNGNSWSANLDGTYAYSDTGTVFAYLTQQHMQRELTELQSIAAVAASATRVSSSGQAYPTWTNRLKGDDTTVGLGVKQAGLMGSRLELASDLTYSLARTGYDTQLNYTGTTTAGLTCSDPAVLSCGALPDIRNRLLQFKLVGNYKLQPSAKVAVGYTYQNLKSTDYYYNGLQYGYTPTALMPTNQQAGSYSVNVVTASYSYSF